MNKTIFFVETILETGVGEECYGMSFDTFEEAVEWANEFIEGYGDAEHYFKITKATIETVWDGFIEPQVNFYQKKS